MIQLLKEIKVLKQNGKLHNKLIQRTRILFIISAILLAIVIYNTIVRDIDILIAILLSFIGFVLGVLVFSRMSVVNWNEDEEVVKSGKMDTIGFATVGLYIAFEIGLRTFLKEYFPTEVIPLLIAAIFGTILGRAIGTLIEIHRVYEYSQKDSGK